jgi:cytochrome c-type biogenesis protein
LPDVSIPVALGAGFLSFFSPCILPLIPAYITYITGTTIEEELKDKKLFALIRTLGFVIGFSIIFIIFGLSAGLIGQTFYRYKNTLTRIGGAIIIVFGLNMMGILKLSFLNKQTGIKAPKTVNSWFSSILMGMVFATGWTPCIGAVLGTILVYAGTTTTVLKGFYLLLAYSIGMAIPFLLTALLINQFAKLLVKIEGILPYVMKLSGIIIVALGILMVLNKMYLLSNLFV